MTRSTAVGFAIALAAAFGCGGHSDTRTPPTDAATGEVPVISAYLESSGLPMLAIWKDGSAQWYGELVRNSERMVGARLGPDTVAKLTEQLERTLARFEDTGNDSRLVDMSPFTLDWSCGSGRRRVSTYHICGPNLPTVLRSRWSVIGVEGADDPRRATLAARIEKEEHGFVQAFDQVVGALVDELRAHPDPNARVRELANATR